LKVSSEKVAEHREALLTTARRLLQERGFDGAGVAEISREAGLTQGALYGQFRSKDGLAAEAIRKSFAEGAEVWETLRGKDPGALQALLETYLCEAHTSDLGSGCALAACVSEIGRQNATISAAYADGFRQLVETVRQVLPANVSADEARGRAIALLAGMVGSVAIARAVAKADLELSSSVLAAGREQFARLATERLVERLGSAAAESAAPEDCSDKAWVS
jgi:TetR/AcrR family transcriptional regulator, transcriptional repressor for nem operon